MSQDQYFKENADFRKDQRPNNRDRIHEWLLRIFRTHDLAAIGSINILRPIAEYIAVNMSLVAKTMHGDDGN